MTRYTDLVITTPCSDRVSGESINRWTALVTRALDFRAESWSGLTVGMRQGFFRSKLTVQVDSMTATEANFSAFTELFQS